MPELDGYQTTIRIRSKADASANLPIVALTADGTSGDFKKCFDAGMNDFLGKPIHYPDFICVLQKYLRQV